MAYEKNWGYFLQSVGRMPSNYSRFWKAVLVAAGGRRQWCHVTKPHCCTFLNWDFDFYLFNIIWRHEINLLCKLKYAWSPILSKTNSLTIRQGQTNQYMRNQAMVTRTTLKWQYFCNEIQDYLILTLTLILGLLLARQCTYAVIL